MSKVIYRIGGMNNVADPADVGAPADSRVLTFTEGVLLVNVDPGDKLSLRPGRSTVLEGSFHSGWSNPYAPKEAYFVGGSILKRLDIDGTITALRYDMVADAPVSFVQVNDAVAYSNGTQFGVIEGGVDTEPFVPTMPYKVPMVAGKVMEWYNGRLYALVDRYKDATGCVLICSDSIDTPGGIESMDERQNVVAIFDGDGTMIQRVDDGLFIGTSLETFFLQMSDAVLDGGLQRQTSVAPYGVVQGTNQPIKGELVRKGGNCALWYSARGVCLGGPGGAFANLTQEKVSVPVGQQGAAVVWEKNGQVFYKVATQGDGEAYNPFGSSNLNDDVDETYA